jgi:hypothetical protein
VKRLWNLARHAGELRGLMLLQTPVDGPISPLRIGFNSRAEGHSTRFDDGLRLGVAAARGVAGRTGMKGFKEKTFADRLQEAAEARKAALERFRARPAADDPDVLKRREERLRIAKAREERETARRAQKEAEAAARAEREAAEKAEREARERREAVEKLIRDAADAAERKAARDARYAARKARAGKKRSGGGG